MMPKEYWFEEFTPKQLQETSHQDYINNLASEDYRIIAVNVVDTESVLLLFERDKPLTAEQKTALKQAWAGLDALTENVIAELRKRGLL